ncbi:MAG: hypothetical protein A2W98_07070 [Bacteroidetes bacterium GWF2_33_38]|nr:MAG: hypothetical protein A2W98_07070 [Bacteroidetes bacterium GWF2_33_38]OFY68125.1 MAG: hypothetical protein A2265_00325 [Bacteroidetes bacterium RIFOXYA12_FULL_33_9]OFY91983.1 MAG: hypothetical protein A2236_13640 [Bacteroidetes bacterium RIFOXYA2_FULL_33_7]
MMTGTYFSVNIDNLSLTSTETGILKGKITDKFSGTGISGVDISVFANSKNIASCKSDLQGKFTINNLPKGTYVIMISHTNYKKDERKIVIETDKVSSLNLSLEPIAKEREILKNEDESKISLCETKTVLCDIPNASVAKEKCGKRADYDMAAMSIGGYAEDLYSEQFNTESYDVINENNYKEVLNDPLSTFSIDVDRASYSNVRRFVNQSTLPHKDVVRIEEMINYFDYNYPQPKNGDPFSVNLEMNNCPWNEDHKLVLVGLQGENIKSEKIPANNLVFLIDVSGSMADANKLPLLKNAFKILVDKLRPQDRVAIVVYAGAAGLVLEPTSGNEKAKILEALDRLNAGGSTAGGDGIKLAYKVAKESFIAEGNNRVILATDGDFNIGASSDAEMVSLIEEKRNDGVFLTVLGFGMGNYKDSKMEQISNAGNGNYSYIDNIMEANKIFGKELWGTLYTIAKDVKIQIEFNPNQVKAYRLIGYENRMLNKEDFNNDKKDAGEIGSGHTVTALYEVILANSKEQVNKVDPLEYQTNNVVNSDNLMTVKLRYKKPNEDESILIVKRVSKEDLEVGEGSGNFNFAASVAEFGMLLRDSEHKANASFGQVLALAKQSKGNDENGYRSEFIKLVETASLLSR